MVDSADREDEEEGEEEGEEECLTRLDREEENTLFPPPSSHSLPHKPEN